MNIKPEFTARIRICAVSLTFFTSAEQAYLSRTDIFFGKAKHQIRNRKFQSTTTQHTEQPAKHA